MPPTCTHLNLSWLHTDNPNYTQNCWWVFTTTLCWKQSFLVSTGNNFPGTACNYICPFHGCIVWIVQSPCDVSPPVPCSAISTDDLQSKAELFGVPMCMTLHFLWLNFGPFLLLIFSKLITHFFPCDAPILHCFINVLYHHHSSAPCQLSSPLNMFCKYSAGFFQTSSSLLLTTISLIIPISK